jgi:glycosyltransferase involved in cell wall biosynthesis
LSAPIALFAYNRPDKLKASLESLRANQGAQSSDLYIFVDGPRDAQDIAKVEKVSDISRNTEGFRSVTVKISQKNLGLANSIRSGISTVLQESNSIIVIEDDLLLGTTFLEFMNAGLTRFATDKRVASIQGFQYPVSPPLTELVAIRGADCWGWATWKDRWDSTIFDTNQLLSELRSRSLEYEFDLDGSMAYTKMLENQERGLIDSWAICWHASMFLQDRVSIHPSESLVFNSGNDGLGTHKSNNSMFNTNLGSWNSQEAWPVPQESESYRTQLITFYDLSFNKRLSVLTRVAARLMHQLDKIRSKIKSC